MTKQTDPLSPHCDPTEDFVALCASYGETRDFTSIQNAWEGGAFLTSHGLNCFFDAAGNAIDAHRKNFGLLWGQIKPCVDASLATHIPALALRQNTPLVLDWAEEWLKAGHLLDPSRLEVCFPNCPSAVAEKRLAKQWRQWSEAGYILPGWQTHPKILSAVVDELRILKSTALVEVFFEQGVALESPHQGPWPHAWMRSYGDVSCEGWLASKPNTNSMPYRLFDAYLVAGGDFSGVFNEKVQDRIELRRAQRRAAILGLAVEPVPSPARLARRM